MSELRTIPDGVRTIGRSDGMKCKHFTGTMQDACAAGVAYKDVNVHHDEVKYRYVDGGPVYTSRGSLPCIQRYNHAGCTCPKAEFPTPEEIEARRAEQRESLERVKKVRPAIMEDAIRRGYRKGSQSVRGEIPCPACGVGTVAYSVASYNGHVHAACSTGKCVAWME